MKEIHPNYIPVEGKTYSLFGYSNSTDEFYKFLDELVETFFYYHSLDEISALISNKKPLHKIVRTFFKEHSEATCSDLHKKFNQYTIKADIHLKNLSLSKWMDKSLRTSRLRHNYYLLEYELINRCNKEIFLQSPNKIALLPHCLRDLNPNCKAQADDIDMVCKHCSKDCFINYASRILKEKGVHSYLWMNIDDEDIMKKLLRKYGQISVFGMACIPELINGMRNCIRKGISVIGLPLNANRCRRWFGETHENSFSIERLQEFLNKLQR